MKANVSTLFDLIDATIVAKAMRDLGRSDAECLSRAVEAFNALNWAAAEGGGRLAESAELVLDEYGGALLTGKWAGKLTAIMLAYRRVCVLVQLCAPPPCVSHTDLISPVRCWRTAAASRRERCRCSSLAQHAWNMPRTFWGRLQCPIQCAEADLARAGFAVSRRRTAAKHPLAV